MTCSAPDQNSVGLTGAAPSAGAGPREEAPTVIEGRVLQDGAPAAGAYVRLLDATGEFTAEVVAGAQGQFRFYAAPGLWTVRALAPGVRGARTVQADGGRIALDLALAAEPGGR